MSASAALPFRRRIIRYFFGLPFAAIPCALTFESMKRFFADLAVLIAIVFWLMVGVTMVFGADPGDFPIWAKILGGFHAAFGASVPFILWAFSMSDISERKEEETEKWYWYYQVFGIALGPLYYWRYLRPKI
jgi:hypothetical protein